MRIQHNIMAMSAYRNYSNNTSALSKNLEKLSSGYKINRAGDDAAGLAISEKMRAQITGLKQAQANAKSGINLVQTAEGALTEVHDMLNRMVKLADQSANGTYDDGVDRVQLQKELDQLRSEVDRIADASNFNGIKLLDGKLGLNTDAFEITSAAATEATGGNVAGTDIAVNDANAHFEVSGNTTQTAPGLVIDLGTLTADASAGNTTLKINALGKEFTLTLADDGGTASDGKYTTADIADALKDAIAADTTLGVDPTTGLHDAGDATKNTGIKLGDFVFTAASATGKITLTYAGLQSGTDAADFKATGDFTTDQADAINGMIGQSVKVTDTGDAVVSGDVIHNTDGVTYAQAKTPSTYAGVDIDLSKIVGQGNTLTIDGTTYVFQTDASTAPTGGTVINVSKGKDLTEQIHMAVDALSKQTAITGETGGTANGRTWTISSAGDTKIHIDQTAATTDTTKALKTYDDVAAVISATTPVVAAKNVGTSIKVTNGNVKEGDVLTIGEGDNAKKYVFTDKESNVPEGAIQVKITGGAAKNLKAAIGSSAEINDAGDTVTIRAASKDDKAPVVLGKGLTLQIGESSDNYNQLRVSIKDMHCAALGIDKKSLNIDTQEAAADAVAKLTNAINQVSDMRGTLGATQNRLDHTINNLSVMEENIQDAESNIRDVDVAEEMMAYTKNNILVQSAQAMLAQANQVPQGVLQLLQ